MRYTDIAIVGGGLAGSTAAATLGRRGIAVTLIDPHPSYPPDFRCEKLNGDQVDIFARTGLTEDTLKAATHDGEIWIGRFGRVVDKKPSRQYGIRYEDLVNTIRAELPAGVETIFAKAVGIATSVERQRVTLSNGEEVSARLVVLSSGLNLGIRHALGLQRKIISSCHCISIGFDLAPRDGTSFPFPAMTYFSERPSARAGYITLFPIGKVMRANLFVYRPVDDPWVLEMRHAPEQALQELMPRLARITGAYKIDGPVKIRPADLYLTEGHRQPGVVVVGDAFCTSCPATGTGTDKVFTDIDRLCNVHVPAWLATEGMDENKIAAFYDDPVKTACDAWAAAQALSFRSVSIDRSPYWAAQRWARFLLRSGQGMLRRIKPGIRATQPDPGGAGQTGLA